MKSPNNRNWKRWAALPFLSMLGACGTTSDIPQVVSGSRAAAGDNVTVAVASVERGGSCSFPPCNVLFKTPPGEGQVRIVVNGFDIGSFPRGETVSLGRYTESLRISMPDTDYGMVFVHIPNNNIR